MMSYPDTSLAQVANRIKLDENYLIQIQNKNWILSYSGGADSILALNILLNIHRLYPIKKRKLLIYYLDHGDQNFQDSANRKEIMDSQLQNIKLDHPDLQVRFFFRTRDMKKISRRIGGNFELTSGRIRYKHIHQIYNKNPDSIVVTGHNMSDWLETLILRLNRGASPEKVYPFLPHESFREMEYFRPLVLLSSQEIREMCGTLLLKYWDDPSNFDGGNMRSKIRNVDLIYNPEGFRRSALNFFKTKKSFLENHSQTMNRITQYLITISSGREYRLEYQYFINLPQIDRDIILDFILQKLNMWPVSLNLRSAMNTMPFSYKVWSIEKENWSGIVFLVFRRGCSNLSEKLPDSNQTGNHGTITGDFITKKYFIRMPYGNKVVKKIFSEKNLSHRQRKSISLIMNINNPYEVLSIPLSKFGLKDIDSEIYFVT